MRSALFSSCCSLSFLVLAPVVTLSACGSDASEGGGAGASGSIQAGTTGMGSTGGTGSSHTGSSGTSGGTGSSQTGSSGSGSGTGTTGTAGPATGTSGSAATSTTGTTGTSGSASTGTGGSASTGTSGSASTGTSGSASTGSTGTTGTSGSGSTPDASTGAGDASSSHGDAGGECRPAFASGVNVAWFTYAGDVPNPSISKFTSLYTNVYNAGGRVVRWWFHTDGTVTPGYTNGQATPITQSQINDVKSILDAAYNAGVAVNISLWAFDMLTGGNSKIPITDNMNLLTNDTDRQAYITNVLTPLVMALKGYHGLYSWEIFNEPEGMTIQNGWTTSAGGQEVDEKYIQITTNWFADAIHTADPNALVTVGSWTFLAVSPTVGTNYYSDSALIAAGTRAKGTLDYYQVHYYDNWGSAGGAEKVSPFQNPLSHWGLTDNKPVVIGEFWDIDTYANGTTNTVKSADLYTTLYGYNYAGAWAWQYANTDNPGPSTYPSNSEQTTWGPLMQTSIDNLYMAHPSAVVCQ